MPGSAPQSAARGSSRQSGMIRNRGEIYSRQNEWDVWEGKMVAGYAWLMIETCLCHRHIAQIICWDKGTTTQVTLPYQIDYLLLRLVIRYAAMYLPQSQTLKGLHLYRTENGWDNKLIGSEAIARFLSAESNWKLLVLHMSWRLGQDSQRDKTKINDSKATP